MPKEIQDIHIGQLNFVTEAAPASGKYKRYSIPNLQNRFCLGYLEGPAASLIKATRNERKYPIQLWQRVENSEDFQEGMECAVIVGELDHPPERVDYSLSNGAVILTDWEIREDEGILWARFAILDTPEGRKVIAYTQFGTALGVSSRGLGDEIILNGETCIDPETYEFYCFDVVAFPAVKTARQTYVSAEEVTESVKIRKDKFSEVLTEQLAKASTQDELINLRNVVESTNVPDKESLVESISYKLSSLSESTDNQSNTGEEAVADESDNEKQILLSNLAEKDTALDKLTKELESTKELLKRRGENANYFRRVVQEQQEEIDTLNAAVSDCLESVSDVSTQLEDSNTKLESVQAELEASKRSLSESRSKANNYKRLAECSINKLNRELASYRKDLKESRQSVAREAHLVNVIKSDSKNQLNHIASLEAKLANETVRNVEALREAKEASHESELKVESLVAENTELKQRVLKLEQESALAKTKLQESVTKRKESNEKTATLLTNYLRKCCEANGISFDAAKEALPESFTMNDADRVVSELVDRQDRFNMLPITLSPRQGRVVEHRTSQPNPGVSSFVVEALNRGQKTTN